MEIDECIELADLWAERVSQGSEGWRVACKTLADEVRRLRADTQEIAAARAFLRERNVLLREIAALRAKTEGAR